MTNKLKPFDLEAAKSGETVITRGGRKVLTLAHFPHIDGKFKVYAHIQGDSDPEWYYEDGHENHNNIESKNDLFMATKTKKLWIGIRKRPITNEIYNTTNAYDNIEKLYYFLSTEKEEFHVIEIEIEE